MIMYSMANIYATHAQSLTSDVVNSKRVKFRSIIVVSTYTHTCPLVPIDGRTRSTTGWGGG